MAGRDFDIVTLRIKKVFPADASQLFSIFSDDAGWPIEFGARVLKRIANQRVVVGLSDFSRPEITLVRVADGVEVQLVHDLIKTDEDKQKYRKLWESWFEEITKRVAP